MPDERYPTAGDFWSAVCAAQGVPDMPPAGDSVISWSPESERRAPSKRPSDGSVRPWNVSQESTRPPDESLAQTKRVKRPPLDERVFTAPSLRDTLRTALERASRSRLAGIVTGVVTAIGFGFCAMHATTPRAQGASTAPAVVSAVRIDPVVMLAATCPANMTSVDGGKFFMGNDDPNADPEERPAHQVTLSPYCIDRYEVTVADYAACSESGECKRAPTEASWRGITRAERTAFSTLCNGSRADRADHPVNCVDWGMAAAYCAWKQKRLPTEAEWEFAARGPDGRRYPWGDEAPDQERLNACGKECIEWGAQNGVEMSVRGRGMYGGRDAFVGTAPVGSFSNGKSRYGIFDLAGNVWEWTADWEGKYAAQPAVDPAGPMHGVRRIVRGGGFNGVMPAWVRSTQRYGDDPAARSHAYGFRCARMR
jgi:formylglycine-generating enzyme required for sulfatase activity